MATTFAVIYTVNDDTELQNAIRPAHRDFLRQRSDDGSLLVAGTWVSDEPLGGLLIFHAEDKAAVQAIVDRDPFTTHGVVIGTQIYEWAPPLGPLASAFNPSA